MSGLTFGDTLSDPAVFGPTDLLPWQRTVLERLGVDPDSAQRLLDAASSEPPLAPIPADPPLVKSHGDPTLDPSGIVVPVDADCPHCGWPERTFDTRTRRFGCIRCTYESDERNA